MKVYQAIAKVQAALAKEGIGKDRNNQRQGYKFRGIDDIYNALAPHLSANGLCILPRALARQCDERTSAKGSALFYVTVDSEFDFVCAEDGSKHTVRTFGEAMDSGDKATNKALSAAYKYACMQAFCIPTEGDNDTENHTHEVTAKPRPESAKTVGQADWDSLDIDTQYGLTRTAMVVNDYLLAEDDLGAIKFIESKSFDAVLKSALWSRFDSKQRARLKKAGEQVRAAA